MEYPDKEIVYHVYENGLINYYYRKKKTQEKPATSSEKVKEQEKDYSGLERIRILHLEVHFFRCSSSFCVIAFTGKKRDNSCSMN